MLNRRSAEAEVKGYLREVILQEEEMSTGPKGEEDIKRSLAGGRTGKPVWLVLVRMNQLMGQTEAPVRPVRGRALSSRL